MNEKIERRYDINLLNGEEETKGRIYGRPVVFNSVTDLGFCDEIIDADALNECDMKDVRLCLNHDTSYVYARSRNNTPNSTMQLGIDAQGLTFDAILDVDNSARAKDLYSAISRGDIDQMSFMFTVEGERWENVSSEHPIRHITKIGKIFEISAVPFPAYEDTSIYARDLVGALENARTSLENERAEERAKKIQMLEEKLNLME